MLKYRIQYDDMPIILQLSLSLSLSFIHLGIMLASFVSLIFHPANSSVHSSVNWCGSDVGGGGGGPSLLLL